ncbi:branched-subunit amino acid aminotransferase/4-amino-4-deoxychorismate lyase [Kribbella voronezhensis]|uniref:Branched-subunit amino acid aminotransferase/4-amino-4-deoxychorismate lyase n=1 Tax=Kribbella voronezhensis TaxID=2512212 RepID=A0A4R7TFW0_9ACTN|nr:branched-subunit amino acid aminotransferase/4-amino-4-deoxychorismate lyase [Kribbella voronezhensis]
MNALLVADSFLIAAGKVRGLELHRERFTASCAAAGFDGAGEFWDGSLSRIPTFGRWFPRFELSSDGPALQVRPAPSTGGRIRVAIHTGPDPRTTPLVKGPDLEALAALKQQAFASYSADELLLVDTDGVALEAAYSALAWWEDDTLCFPPSDRPFLPSVTARLVRQLASTQGVPTAERARTADELASYETWLLNALHGIRPIHAWNHGPIDPLPASTATTWQSHLAALARSL